MLNHLCRDQYTIEELRARPLPEGSESKTFNFNNLCLIFLGVDPSKIESYLSDGDFQVRFNSFTLSFIYNEEFCLYL